MSRLWRLAWFQIVLCFAPVIAGPALAQSGPTLQPIPPANYSVDPQGVDVVSGAFIYSTTEVLIGQPDNGGLVYGRTWLPRDNATGAGGWRNNQVGTINTRSGEYVVSVGEFSDIFTLSGSVFTPKSNRGSTLTQDSATFTYTSASGSVVTFSKALADHYSSFSANEGVVVSRREPDGLTTTYHYIEEEVCTPPGTCTLRDGLRLQSVTNNRGYQLHFDYVTDDPSAATGFFTIQKVTGFNMATDYCDPLANDCTFTRTWPSITYTSSGAEDQSSRVTQYFYTADELTGMRAPGATANDFTLILDSNDQVTSLTGPAGAWTYTYTDDPAVRQTLATGPLGQSTRTISSRSNGRPVTSIDAENNVTRYYWNEGRLARLEYPEGNSIAWRYDVFGNIDQRTATDKDGDNTIVTSWEYPDDCDNVILCHRPESMTEASSNPSVDPRVTSYTWDENHGGLLKLEEPAPVASGARPTTVFTYATRNAYYKNSLGVIVAGSDIILPVSIAQCPDASTCSGDVDESVVQIAYGATGVANNLLPTVHTYRNGTGSLSSPVTTTYTPEGDPQFVDGPLSGTSDQTRYHYDTARQLIGEVGPDPDGASGPLLYRATRYSYLPRGIVSKVEAGTTTGQGNGDWASFSPLQQTTFGFDGYGRVLRAESQTAAGATYTLTQTSYDAAGRPECVALRMNPGAFASLPASACSATTAGSFGSDRIVQNQYNNLGQLAGTVSGVGQTVTPTQTEVVTYTDNGQIETVVDGEGNTTTLVYDGFDRLSEVRFPNVSGSGSSTSDKEVYTYDAFSNIATVVDRSGQTTAFSYDRLNRVTLVNAPSGTSDTTYTYDLVGNVTQTGLVTSTAHNVENTWDALGRLVSQKGRSGLIQYQYDLAGRNTRLTWPNAAYVTYVYDNADAVIDIRESGTSSLATYTYDNLGRRTALNRAPGTWTQYVWNPQSRIERITHNLPGYDYDVHLTYAYNPAGQVVSRNQNKSVYAYTGSVNGTQALDYDGLNRIDETGFVYDGRGNLTDDSVRDYTYNSYNQLRTSPSPSMTLSYDPEGRLYGLSQASENIRFQYDGLTPVAEYASNDTDLLRRHVPGPGLDEYVLTYEGTGTTNRTWYYADDLGSVIATDGAPGVSINTYDEYGVPGAANTGRFQYTGQVRLPGDLYSYRTRAYAPSLGRFLQTDTIGYEAGANLYAYVEGDPTNAIDPLGTNRTCGIGEYTDGRGSRPVEVCFGPWLDIFGFDFGLMFDVQGRHFSDRGSIYDRLRPGGPPSVSALQTPEYAAWRAAYEKASDENAWMLIPVAAPVAAPIAGEAAVGWLLQAGVRAAPGAIARACANCFEAGTLVQTESGLTPIEEIEVGDQVLARDEVTGETSYRAVTALIDGAERQIWEVTVEVTGVDGEVVRETFGVTDDHPWRTIGGDWAMSAELYPGIELVTADGDRAVVVSAGDAGRVVDTFNFEVEGFHTYFVGENGLWVHNSCLPAVSRVVNSNMGHAASRAVERGVVGSRQAAVSGLRALGNSIKSGGWPSGAIRDTARANRILVPFGNNGMAVYSVSQNSVATLRTVLIAH